MSVATLLTDSRTGYFMDKCIVHETVHRPLPSRSHASLCEVRYLVNEGVAVLRGRVPSFYLKQLAQEIVRKIDGVCEIINEMEVSSAETPVDIHERRH